MPFTLKLRNEDNSIKAEHTMFFLPFKKYKLLINTMEKLNEKTEGQKEITPDERYERTALLICELFNGKFTKEELMDSIDFREIASMPLDILAMTIEEKSGADKTGEEKNVIPESVDLSTKSMPN